MDIAAKQAQTTGHDMTTTTSIAQAGSHPLGGVLKALFLDIPYILDSALRRMEFWANRTCNYSVDPKLGVGKPRERPYWRQPPFWFFVITLAFVAFGPTFDASCTLLGVQASQSVRNLESWTCYALALIQFLTLGVVATVRAHKRFEHEEVQSLPRRVLVWGILWSASALFAYPWLELARYLDGNPAASYCTPATSLMPAWGLLATFAAALIAAFIVAHRVHTFLRRILSEGLILLIMVLALWVYIAPAGATESQQVPYVHVFGFVALGLAFIACFSPLLIRAPCRSRSFSAEHITKWREALCTTELFPGPRSDPDLSWRRVLASLVLGILRFPFHLLLLPAMFVVFSSGQNLWWVAPVSLCMSAMLLAMGNLCSRWQQPLKWISRWFLTGTPLLVSLMVIVLAALRLAGVQYVTTILDVASFGVLFLWIVMAYALFWWFEHHVNAVLVARTLAVLGASQEQRHESVAYRLCRGYVNSSGTSVEWTDRWLAPHGLGSVAVLGWFRDAVECRPTTAFFTYRVMDLLAKLAGDRAPGLMRDMERRVHLYFACVNLLIVVAGLGLWWQFNRGDAENTVQPMVKTAVASAGNATADLAGLLAAPRDDSSPAVIVAASGGGTRAAFYAAHGLGALSALGHARDIVLLSGVSGGGVASAYFYAHREELSSGSADEQRAAWKRFRDLMRAPFISDVLEGAGEWRIFTDHPLSALLAESFERRLFDNRSDATLGLSNEVGLLLNTTLTGHPLAFTSLLGKSFSSAQAPEESSCAVVTRPLNNLSGGRLVLTNLHVPAPWDESLAQLPDVRMPFVTVNSQEVRLSAAAALTANFPPVFPNARIDLVAAGTPQSRCPDSFFVTDGGATENLGLVSALLAIRTALDRMPLDQKVRKLHVVAFEASALSYDYQQDRGFGALTGGSKERLTGALTLRLINDVNQRLKARDSGGLGNRRASLRIHYLPLPTVFRSRGGFGTHWMCPPKVTLQDPRVAYLGSRWDRIKRCLAGAETPCSVTLRSAQVDGMWQHLFSPNADFCTRALPSWRPGGSEEDFGMWHVARWICGKEGDPARGDLPPDHFVRAWADLVKELRPGGAG